MTLNLKQIARTVKFAPVALVPNPTSPLGQSAAYRQLKALGWVCVNSEVHPTDRVPVFRLAGAAIRRLRTGAGWIVDVAGGQYERAGCLQQITAEAVALDEPPTPALSPAALEAGGLTSEYPALGKRIAAALALVESGGLTAKLAQYGTRWENLTRADCWYCDCPDSVNRKPRAAFGVACKHALAGEIVARVKRTQRRVAMQKLADKTQRRDYAKPSDYNQPADPLNRARTGSNRAEFTVNYGGGR